ncbi:hypothetical protein GGGNBK_18875 [Sporosarcina sp. ANT_H38]
MDAGWSLRDIDEMDILFFFELHEEEQEKKLYADQVQW